MPGVGWHSMGLGAQGAQGGGRLSAGRSMLAFQQDQLRLKVRTGGGRSGCPGIPKLGDGKDLGTEQDFQAWS